MQTSESPMERKPIQEFIENVEHVPATVKLAAGFGRYQVYRQHIAGRKDLHKAAIEMLFTKIGLPAGILIEV